MTLALLLIGCLIEKGIAWTWRGGEKAPGTAHGGLGAGSLSLAVPSVPREIGFEAPRHYITRFCWAMLRQSPWFLPIPGDLIGLLRCWRGPDFGPVKYSTRWITYIRSTAREPIPRSFRWGPYATSSHSVLARLHLPDMIWRENSASRMIMFVLM